MQDVTKVVMGSPLSSTKEVECFAVDPANFPAGLCVSLGSDGLPSLLKSAGMRMGVSLGRSLSDHKKTDVLRAGLKVPVRAALKRATGSVVITNFSNLLTTTPDSVTIGATLFVAQSGATTPGQATFRAATSTAATAVDLAAQINAHAAASLLVYAVVSSSTVNLYAVADGAGNGSTTGNSVALAYTDNGGGNIGATVSGAALSGGSDTISDIAYAVDGQKMYINDVTGKADIAMTGFSTVSDALYRGALINGVDQGAVYTGVDADGNSVAAVLADLVGSL